MTIINITLSDLMQTQNWHDVGHKRSHAEPDLARGSPVWHLWSKPSHSPLFVFSSPIAIYSSLLFTLLHILPFLSTSMLCLFAKVLLLLCLACVLAIVWFGYLVVKIKQTRDKYNNDRRKSAWTDVVNTDQWGKPWRDIYTIEKGYFQCGWSITKTLESCTGQVDPCGLQVPTFVGQVQEPAELRVWVQGRLLLVQGGHKIRNSSCGLLNVDSMHVKMTWAKKFMLQRACSGSKV